MPDLGTLPGLPAAFDIIGTNAGAQQQGQGGIAGMSPQQAQQLLQLMQANGGQPQAGGQMQPYAGSPLMAGILGRPQYGGQPPGAQPQLGQGQGQANGLASAIGSGARGLLDGMMGG